MNLILWVRRLANFPAIGLGSSYQYHIPGSGIRGPKKRVALKVLRRWVRHDDLRDWLIQNISSIEGEDRVSLQQLLDNFDGYDRDSARQQVANFYYKWIKELEQINVSQRMGYLYKQFSNAYVTGTQLTPFSNTKRPSPKGEGIGRRLKSAKDRAGDAGHLTRRS
jgi:hypothetical protein